MVRGLADGTSFGFCSGHNIEYNLKINHFKCEFHIKIVRMNKFLRCSGGGLGLRLLMPDFGPHIWGDVYGLECLRGGTGVDVNQNIETGVLRRDLSSPSIRETAWCFL